MTDNEKFAEIKEKWEANNKDVCPNCGYCPHCGRRNALPYHPYPWYPQPYYPPTYPYSPWIVYTTTTAPNFGNTWGGVSGSVTGSIQNNGA